MYIYLYIDYMCVCVCVYRVCVQLHACIDGECFSIKYEYNTHTHTHTHTHAHAHANAHAHAHAHAQHTHTYIQTTKQILSQLRKTTNWTPKSTKLNKSPQNTKQLSSQPNKSILRLSLDQMKKWKGAFLANNRAHAGARARARTHTHTHTYAHIH